MTTAPNPQDDKELLELAAQAAGIEHGADRTECGLSLTEPDGRHRSLPRWNPLTDDGDALRLAVSCGIEIEPVPFGGRAIVRDDDDYGEQFDEESPDRMSATRRAIVRAAADIARQESSHG